MSFDTTFDFTQNINIMQGRNAYFTSLISQAQTENEQLQSLVDYSELTAPRIALNNGTIASYTASISQDQIFLNSITTIQTLSVENKSTLYEFYIKLGVDKGQFAEKILSKDNVVGMCSDASPIILDTTLSVEEKKLLLSIVYSNYSSNVSLVVVLQ